MNKDEIKRNAPDGATHYIKVDGAVIYVMKLTFWYRYFDNGIMSDWWDYEPGLLYRLFKIKPL